MVAAIALNILLALAFLEGSLALLLTSPSIFRLAPGPLLSVARHVYLSGRVNVHSQPECVRYDPELTYIFRPGTCWYSTPEFTHDLRINSLGLRDDEVSLRAPTIVVTGDSVAMGWGVRQEGTFSQLVEQRTGLTVLNAAVASYGTVREMRLLDRLNVQYLRYLVVQYHENDWVENDTFYRNGNHLPIMEEARYLETVDRYQRQMRYYPGRHTVESFRRIWDRLFPSRRGAERPGVPTKREHVERFLNAIRHGTRADLTRVTLVVLAINSSGKNDSSFIAALRERLASGPSADFVRTLIPLDLESRLTQDTEFLLDDHLNGHGHRVIADALVAVIGADGRASQP